MASKNANLHKAKDAKNDEFYTQLTDVAKELMHYKAHFKDKIVFCNCDDPTWSAFWKYFHLNFELLGLKKLISTHYDKEKPTYKMEYTGGNDNDIEVGVKTPLEGNGDFRNQECLDLLDECDIVVTNPPFSCYSSDTEVMTNNGWKYFKDVDISKDLIMSLNPNTKQAEFVCAVDYLCNPYKGKMYHFHNRNMDFMVTPNHKMYSAHIISYSQSNKRAYRETRVISEPLRDAEQVKKSTLLPIANFSWIGNDEEYFYLPETTQLEQYSRRKIIVPAKKIKMEDWLEFFGFYLADGCYRDHINTFGKRDYTVQIAQNAKNEQYVLDLINRIGFSCKICNKSKSQNRVCNNYSIYSKQLWEYLSQFGRSAEKYIPEEFMALDTKYLKALLKGYENGDCSHCTNGSIHYSSASKKLIDNVQQLILRVYGVVVQVKKITRKHSYDDGVGVCYSITTTLNQNNNKNFSKYGVPDKVSYNNNVYCLTLERNHIMLVRHNGIIGWCGNCFREYVATLMEHQKKFLIIGNKNAITYKEFFPLLKDDKVWIGCNSPAEFSTPDGMTKKLNGLTRWFTNLDVAKRHEKLILWKKYTPEEYPKFDELPDVINIDKVQNIPVDFDGLMAVPITFLDKYNPEQFEIIDALNRYTILDYFGVNEDVQNRHSHCCNINGKSTYYRIVVRKKEGN